MEDLPMCVSPSLLCNSPLGIFSMLTVDSPQKIYIAIVISVLHSFSERFGLLILQNFSTRFGVGKLRSTLQEHNMNMKNENFYTHVLIKITARTLRKNPARRPFRSFIL